MGTSSTVTAMMGAARMAATVAGSRRESILLSWKGFAAGQGI